jgi:membrane dipeptidase
MPLNIFDAHLDLSMNALDWNRDLRTSLAEIKECEDGMTDKPDRGNGVVCFSEMKKGGIGICVATQISRFVKKDNPLPGWHSPEQAWAHAQGQLAWYKEMERQGYMRQINDLLSLESHLSEWNKKDVGDIPLGYILSLEGADSIISMEHLEMAWDYGLRAVGPAHYGPGTYAHGTDSHGGIGQAGRELLAKMESLGMILDATHLCDLSFWEALDNFGGPVWASHSNCRTLVPNHRQFSDEQIGELVSRDAVIGGVMDAWMLVPGWERGVSNPQNTEVSFSHLADHIDHICQLAGDARHVGIGSDLDGGFGSEQCPSEIISIADLQRLPDFLTKRNFTDKQIEQILCTNWLDFLRRTWDSMSLNPNGEV